MGGVQRPWSEAKGVTFDDHNFIVTIKDGWRGKKKLHCPETLYPKIKKFVQDRIEEQAHREDLMEEDNSKKAVTDTARPPLRTKL